MEVQDAIDMAREAIMVTMLVSSPVLIAGMAVGLIVGLLQAVTQIQEQTISFVPKLVAMVLALSLSMPWLLSQLLQYFRDVIVNIPNRL